mmetsp:Transcript_98555/g.169821  ORF Transcript_98555/g.169821 Transcript_98555/m.169821 type:complete len:127 (-) Transcript_98555:18-398(-)
MHYSCRQGIQWEWHAGCRGLMTAWLDRRRRLKLEGSERLERLELEREYCQRLEGYARCTISRECYSEQRRLGVVAKGLARVAGLQGLKEQWRQRVVRQQAEAWHVLFSGLLMVGQEGVQWERLRNW